VLLLGPGAAANDPWAVVQVLLAALGYATAPIIADRYLRDVPTIPLTATCLGLTALLYLPFTLLTGHPHLPGLHAALALLALGVVCTGLAFVLFFRLIAEVGAARSTLVAYLNPVVAVALGAAVLHESVTLTVLLATALILAGSAAASRRGSRGTGSVGRHGTEPMAAAAAPAVAAASAAAPRQTDEPEQCSAPS
jgi:drug/metabolite transporter (DMT)-like permease